MRSSYKEEDVILLLKDITGLVKPQSTEERERMIQSGRHYCEMLPVEYAPSEKYMEAYHTALKGYAGQTAKAVGKVTKGFQNTLFSIAFVCIGLETRFKEIFSKENRKPLTVFLTAQAFNIIVTLIISYVIFGIVKPLLA